MKLVMKRAMLKTAIAITGTAIIAFFDWLWTRDKKVIKEYEKKMEKQRTAN